MMKAGSRTYSGIGNRVMLFVYSWTGVSVLGHVVRVFQTMEVGSRTVVSEVGSCCLCTVGQECRF